MSKIPLLTPANSRDDQGTSVKKLAKNLAITPEGFFVQPMKQIKEGTFLQHDGLRGKSLQSELIQHFQAAVRSLKFKTLIGLDSLLNKKHSEMAQGEFATILTGKTLANINDIKSYGENIRILFRPYFCEPDKLPLHLQPYPGVIDLADVRHSPPYFSKLQIYGWPLTLNVIDEVTDTFLFEGMYPIDQLTTIADQWHTRYCEAFGEPSLYELTRLVLTMADNIALLLPSED